MTTFPNSPKLLKGGIVLVDPESSAVGRIIPLQYNPDTLSRTLQVQAIGTESGSRSEPLRIKARPVETIKLDAEIDATDQLEFPDQNGTALELGAQTAPARKSALLTATRRNIQNEHLFLCRPKSGVVPVGLPNEAVLGIIALRSGAVKTSTIRFKASRLASTWSWSQRRD